MRLTGSLFDLSKVVLRFQRPAFPPIVLPVFLAAADGTVVATALPAIAASLGQVELLSWVVVANLIANTIAAPPNSTTASRM